MHAALRFLGLALACSSFGCFSTEPVMFGTADTGSSGGTGAGPTSSTTVPAGGSTQSDDGGSDGGAECEVDADCDDDEPCTMDRCDAGRCTPIPIDGERDEGQTSHDCRVLMCVDGATVSTPDPDDRPDDLNVCTLDACEDGEPVFTPVAAGTTCGLGTCDADGHCVECLGPGDCTDLPADDECRARTCDDDTCGEAFTAEGVPLGGSAQTAGDCRIVVCDGAGGTTTQADDADLPVDGLPCTQDLCTGGTPSNPPVAGGVPCSAGECDGQGSCVGCITPGDCGTSTFCQAMTCVAGVCGVANQTAGTPLPAGQQTGGDCQEVRCNAMGQAQPVADPTDLPTGDGNVCTDEVCVGGMPQHPALPSTTPCDDGSFCTAPDACDGAGQCEGGDDPCPGPDGDPDCSESCDEADGACSAPDPADSPCDDALFCNGAGTCDAAGACVPGAAPCPVVAPSGCQDACDEDADDCSGSNPPGTACDDGLACTTADVCDGAGACGGDDVACTPPQACFECCGGCAATDCC